MRLEHHSSSAARRGAAAFTMVEIALALAVIGFALVAIIGVLPLGLNSQKENREDTIVNQDVAIWFEALRTGSQGPEDFGFYVDAITNYQTWYNLQNGGFIQKTNLGYTHTTPVSVDSGFNIVGLLSTPQRYADTAQNLMFSNHVVAYVRALTGPAVNRWPQANAVIRDAAFGYTLTADVIAAPRPPGDTNAVAQVLRANLHEVRLRFDWPLLPNGQVGTFSRTYRASFGGTLVQHGPVSPYTPIGLWLFSANAYTRP
jgi:type II secretory pathway pseudopilin PulG